MSVSENIRPQIRRRMALITYGPSIARCLPKATKKDVIKFLQEIDISDNFRPDDPHSFDKVFSSYATKLHRILMSKKPDNINLGVKWGYAAKILSIYLRLIHANRELTNQSDYTRVKPLLHCPIDSKLFRYLKKNKKNKENEEWIGRAHPLHEIRIGLYRKVQIAVREQAESLRIAPSQVDDLSWTAADDKKAYPRH